MESSWIQTQKGYRAIVVGKDGLNMFFYLCLLEKKEGLSGVVGQASVEQIRVGWIVGKFLGRTEVGEMRLE